MTWRLRSLRGFVLGLVAVQAVQAGRFATDGFLKSYWVVNYDHGYVRRGLAGTVLGVFVGRQTNDGIVIATWVVALGAFVAVLVVLEMLLRRATPTSCALAILLASSPFAIDYVLLQRRPDQLAVPVLVALGIALTRLDRRLLAACAVVGMVFGALTFVHEAVLLIAVPSALLMVVVVLSLRTPRVASSTIARALLFVASPALVAGAIVALVGPADSNTIAALQADAHGVPLGDITVFQYLDDSLRASFDLVTGFPVRVLVASSVLGLMLTAVHSWWLLRWARLPLARDATDMVRGLRAGALAIAIGAAMVLFAIGVDWVRWFAALGCALLIVASFAVLASWQDHAGSPRPDRVRLPRALPIVAVYLAAMAPLPNFAFPKDAIRVLLLRQ